MTKNDDSKPSTDARPPIAVVGLLCFQGLAPNPSLVGEASSIHPNSPAHGIDR